jgi:hypothetical protein
MGAQGCRGQVAGEVNNLSCDGTERGLKGRQGGVAISAYRVSAVLSGSRARRDGLHACGVCKREWRRKENQKTRFPIFSKLFQKDSFFSDFWNIRLFDFSTFGNFRLFGIFDFLIF